MTSTKHKTLKIDRQEALELITIKTLSLSCTEKCENGELIELETTDNKYTFLTKVFACELKDDDEKVYLVNVELIPEGDDKDENIAKLKKAEETIQDLKNLFLYFRETNYQCGDSIENLKKNVNAYIDKCSLILGGYEKD